MNVAMLVRLEDLSDGTDPELVRAEVEHFIGDKWWWDEYVTILVELDQLPWCVSDSKDVPINGSIPVLGRFATEDLAAGFIGTLPEYETGRYNLDGPMEN